MDLFCCAAERPRKVKKALIALQREASYAVHARAVKDQYNMQDPNHLAFREGDYIRVVEKHPSGMWKGYVVSSDGSQTKMGYFPANNVVLVDPQALAHRPISGYSSGSSGSERSPLPVMSPQVPDLIAKQHQCHSNTHTVMEPGSGHLSTDPAYTHMTVGCDETFPPPPSPLMSPKHPYNREVDRDSGISPQQSYPSPQFPNSPQSFPGRQASPHSPAERTAEWIGRYVSVGAGSDGHSGSPASSSRGSPSSSNRNSITSTNSGGYVSGHYVNSYSPHPQSSPHPQQPNGPLPPGPPHGPPHPAHRLSGQSYESGVSVQSSGRHSGGSSSGSLDRLEESGYASTSNVHDLFQQGLADHEVLRAWLTEQHFEEYYALFIHAGYDMPTISRMTPEDLTAIGITKPNHRKKLKSEISKLHIHDGIPDFKPHTVVQWLQLLFLDEYTQTLASQGYEDVDSLTDITWEDLEEIGIKRLGHQKKIMLGIDRLRRIHSGQFRLPTGPQDTDHRGSKELLEPPSAYPTPQWLDQPSGGPGGGGYYSSGGEATGGQYTAPRSPSLDNLVSRSQNGDPSRNNPNYRPHGDEMLSKSTQQLFPAHQMGVSPGQVAVHPSQGYNPSHYHTPQPHMMTSAAVHTQGDYSNHSSSRSTPTPDVVAIHVNQPSNRSSLSGSSDGSSSLSGGEGMARTHYSFQSPGRSRHSSGDATPTYQSGDETDSSGTLKRPSARVSPLPKPKPIAKVLGTSTLRRSSQELRPADIVQMNHVHQFLANNADHDPAPGYNSKKFSGMTLRKTSSSTEHIYDLPAAENSSPKHVQVSPGVIGTGNRSSAPNSPYKTNVNFFGGNESGGSPGGGKSSGKKPPPPPPKRTNSIKHSNNPHLMHSASQGGNMGEQLSVSIPPDSPSMSQRANHNSPQHRRSNGNQGSPGGNQPPHSPSLHHSPKPMPLLNNSYTSCVKNLSEKFRHNSGGGGPPPLGVKPKIKLHSSTLESEGSPPPRPPPPAEGSMVTKETKHAASRQQQHTGKSAQSAYNDRINPLNDVIHQLELQASSLNTGQNGNQASAHSNGDMSLSNALVSKDTRLGDWQDSHVDSGSDSDTGTLERPQPSATDSSKNTQSHVTNSGAVIDDGNGTIKLKRVGSTSTIDSNTLPFANENVGTIKQRSADKNVKPSIVSVSSVEGESGGEKSVELNASVFSGEGNGDQSDEEETGTIKRNKKYSVDNGASSSQDTESKKSAPPTPQRQASQAGTAEGVKSGDVLNDIGNMLQDLTDELDAMLEFEIE